MKIGRAKSHWKKKHSFEEDLPDDWKSEKRLREEEEKRLAEEEMLADAQRAGNDKLASEMDELISDIDSWWKGLQ